MITDKKMDVHEGLKQAGLTGNEAKVYFELLRRGKLGANQIAKNIGMDRTLAYTVLNHLIEKGQVNYVLIRNKKIFSCSDTENLINLIKPKHILVSNLIKELKKIKPEQQEETEINVYEGQEGIRTLMTKIMKEKNIDAFGSTGRAYDLLFEAPAIAKEAIKKKIWMRVLANEKYRGMKFTEFKNLKIKYINVESESTTSIFGNYVAIHLIKDKPIFILIKNKKITKSYLNYFNWVWERAN